MGFWKRPGDLAVGYRRWGGGHGILEAPRDLAVGYRRWGGVMGFWNDLGIWLSGIGGGGGSWDSGTTWGFGCRV